MSDDANMGAGWYVLRRKTLMPDAKYGPISWEQLAESARSGSIAPRDLIWHASLAEWTSPRAIPGLMGQAGPTPQQAAPISQNPPAMQNPSGATTAQTATSPAAPEPPRRNKAGLAIALALAALLVLGACGLGAFWYLGRSSGSIAGGPSLGTSTTSLPDNASLVDVEEWGEVPANQIGIMLAEGSSRSDAEAVAETLGGTIVGEIEFVSAYQIEFPGATEEDLRAALDTAASSPGVELAYPNQQTELDIEIWGTPGSAYDDPVYGGGAGEGYEAIGVDRAWKYIKASGIELSSVKVGIVDDGLYVEGEGRESEFGAVKVDYPDKEAGQLDGKTTHKDGTTNDAGSHGTGVATIIGADPDNGGPSGVAGPLGDKLEISMINQYGGKYGNVEATPDPNDPTKMVYGDGKTYSHGSLVALNKQIASGAKIINCSWGNAKAHPQTAALYKRYFEKMATDHPDVLFVCSGGNTGKALDGTKRYPSGLALPNMITVGALDNDGSLASYSSKASDNYEVTLGAPGTAAVVGTDPDGNAERQDGTSFAAPHVAAAAAILRSINPKLSAGDIKSILTGTARQGVTTGDTSIPAPPEVGGRVLAIDEAVLKVINDLRAEKDQSPLTAESLELMSSIDAVAISGEGDEWTVVGLIDAAGDGGADLRIDVSADNHAIGGSTTQHLDGAGEVEWSVTLPEGTGIITVTRLDTGASSVINIDQLDINGSWSGTFTISDITITDAEAAQGEGCTAEILEALQGASMPMTMDITVDESGQGSAVTHIDTSALTDGESSGEPQTLQVSFSGSTVTFTGGSELNRNMTATVTRDTNQLVMRGTSGASGPGWTMTSNFTLTKPEQ